MKRIFGLALIAGLALTGLTACMGDDGGSSAERRRSAALVNTGTGTGRDELVITGLTPSGQAISVDSFSWGVANAGTAAQGEPLRFVKTMDEVSPLLLKAVADGKLFASAVLKLHEVAGEGQSLNYATYELGNVVITDLQHSGDADDRPTEKVTLKYSTLKETYTTYSGSAKGPTATYTFFSKA
jgi:type VI secretion system Hcp family effector